MGYTVNSVETLVWWATVVPNSGAQPGIPAVGGKP